MSWSFIFYNCTIQTFISVLNDRVDYEQQIELNKEITFKLNK